MMMGLGQRVDGRVKRYVKWELHKPSGENKGERERGRLTKTRHVPRPVKWDDATRQALCTGYGSCSTCAITTVVVSLARLLALLPAGNEAAGDEAVTDELAESASGLRSGTTRGRHQHAVRVHRANPQWRHDKRVDH
jgi:hypothetical protein